MKLTPRQRAGANIDRVARENFVYSVYDAQGQVLYIGCTRCPDRRWRAHGYTHPGLVAMAKRFRLRGPYTRGVARAIERAAIVESNPLFNREIDKKRKWDEIRRLNQIARATVSA